MPNSYAVKIPKITFYGYGKLTKKELVAKVADVLYSSLNDKEVMKDIKVKRIKK